MTPLERNRELFHSVTAELVDSLGDYYADDATLTDPINAAKGLGEVKLVYKDLFKQLGNVQMTVSDMAGDDNAGFLRWTMSYTFRKKPREIPGVSYVTFTPEGKILSQHDYWDASDGVYGEFPGLGLAIRGIRKMVRVAG